MSTRRDIYGRKPTSESRGKTQQRIMDLQHAPGELPEMAQLLEDMPAGSCGDAVSRFVRGWVTDQPVTSRRSYERTMMLLVRDLHEQRAGEGSELADPVDKLTLERLGQHLRWRIAHGLTDQAELRRATVHLARFTAWANEHVDGKIEPVGRDLLRERLDELLSSRP